MRITWRLVALAITVALLTGCGYPLSESLVVAFDGTEYGYGETIDLGMVSEADGPYYAEIPLRNVATEPITLTTLESDGSIEVSPANAVSLPFSLAVGDGLLIALVISPIEIRAYAATAEFTADGARDSFVISFTATGVSP